MPLRLLSEGAAKADQVWSTLSSSDWVKLSPKSLPRPTNLLNQSQKNKVKIMRKVRLEGTVVVEVLIASPFPDFDPELQWVECEDEHVTEGFVYQDGLFHEPWALLSHDEKVAIINADRDDALSGTDWYVIRWYERGIPIPDEIKRYRQQWFDIENQPSYPDNVNYPEVGSDG